MTNPLVQRVASRYLQAAGSPEALLHKTEAAVYRGEENLKAALHAHGELAKTIVGNEPLRETEKVFHRISMLFDAYKRDITAAMQSLDEYNHTKR